jgi:hypothetical protein
LRTLSPPYELLGILSDSGRAAREVTSATKMFCVRSTFSSIDVCVEGVSQTHIHSSANTVLNVLVFVFLTYIVLYKSVYTQQVLHSKFYMCMFYNTRATSYVYVCSTYIFGTCSTKKELRLLHSKFCIFSNRTCPANLVMLTCLKQFCRHVFRVLGLLGCWVVGLRSWRRVCRFRVIRCVRHLRFG